MPETPTHAEAVEKLGKLIENVNIAMLTTIVGDGQLHSRPMAVQQQEFDGDLWFFTSTDSGKVHQIEDDSRVNVSFANPDKQIYVSISGRARIVRDQAKAEELWNPVLKAWFPDGLDSPDLGLIKVEVDGAEYWDAPASAVAHIVGFVKSMATGQQAKDIGDHAKVKL